MIKCWNIFLLKHLEKNENDKAKHYIDLIENYSIEDYSSYVTSKTNLSCYYNNTNHFRNSKIAMNDIKKLNIAKKLNDVYSDNIYDISFEKKDEKREIKKNQQSNSNKQQIIIFLMLLWIIIIYVLFIIN